MPKTAIHPQFYPKATVTCSCGATYVFGSTKENLRVEICQACHPFYSGNQKLIDTAGRVDRFREKMAQAEARQTKSPKAAKTKKTEETPSEGSNGKDEA